LESYKKNKFDYYELINVLVATETDFIKEKYLYTLPRKISLKWTNEYHSSLETDYNMWKTAHEVNLQEKVIDLNSKNKPYKHIDCDFSTLQNVLSMLNENSYDANYEYNFDLKTLMGHQALAKPRSLKSWEKYTVKSVSYKKAHLRKFVVMTL
jgi:hypothetical protein